MERGGELAIPIFQPDGCTHPRHFISGFLAIMNDGVNRAGDVVCVLENTYAHTVAASYLSRTRTWRAAKQVEAARLLHARRHAGRSGPEPLEGRLLLSASDVTGELLVELRSRGGPGRHRPSFYADHGLPRRSPRPVHRGGTATESSSSPCRRRPEARDRRPGARPPRGLRRAELPITGDRASADAGRSLLRRPVEPQQHRPVERGTPDADIDAPEAWQDHHRLARRARRRDRRRGGLQPPGPRRQHVDQPVRDARRRDRQRRQRLRRRRPRHQHDRRLRRPDADSARFDASQHHGVAGAHRRDAVQRGDRRRRRGESGIIAVRSCSTPTETAYDRRRGAGVTSTSTTSRTSRDRTSSPRTTVTAVRACDRQLAGRAGRHGRAGPAGA